MAEKTPRIVILTPTPTPESVREAVLEYKKPSSASARHAPCEYARIRDFWDTTSESLEELGTAKQLATHYVLMVRIH